MDNLQAGVDDDAGARQFSQHAGKQLTIAGHLLVQPNVADSQGETFQQMKNRFQLDIEQRLARHAAIEKSHANHCFAVKNRQGHLRAENLKFLLDFVVLEGRRLITTEDATGLGQETANAAFVRKIDVINQVGDKADCKSGTHPAARGGGGGGQIVQVSVG